VATPEEFVALRCMRDLHVKDRRRRVGHNLVRLRVGAKDRAEVRFSAFKEFGYERIWTLLTPSSSLS
jgi:hypothetical protein